MIKKIWIAVEYPLYRVDNGEGKILYRTELGILRACCFETDKLAAVFNVQKHWCCIEYFVPFSVSFILFSGGLLGSE